MNSHSQSFPPEGLQNPREPSLLSVHAIHAMPADIRNQDAKKCRSTHSEIGENRGSRRRSAKSSFDGITPEPRSRQTAPCKHFTRTGHCPLGDSCHFIHDLSLGMAEKRIQVEPHCWAHVQGGCCVRSCQYFHPYDIRPYQKYTPCYAWNLCLNQRTCPFKHPEPIFSHTGTGVQMNGTGHWPFYPDPLERFPSSDYRVPYDHRGIYADQPIRARLSKPIAPLEALPGPSFEDSPPSPPVAPPHTYQKIFDIKPTASLPPPEAHRRYTREYGISYYPPYQSTGEDQRFAKEVRISGLNRLGQRRASASDGHGGYSSWVAQLQHLEEEARRKPPIREHP